MPIGMGTTIKQINNIKIKLAIDGCYRLYHNSQKGTCILETPSLTEAINFAKKYS